MGRRRGQRTGYLYEKSGSWILRWREDGRDLMGRPTRDQRSMAIAPSKGPGKIGRREAERLAWDLVLSKLDTVSTAPGSLILFADFVRQRFEPDHLWTLKFSGQEHYKYILTNHVLPFLGKHRLRDISTMVLQDLFRTKRDKYSTQTLAHIKNVISAVFRHARACNVFSGQLPTDGLKLPSIHNAERPTFTIEQAIRLIAALPGQYAVLAALLFCVGLRIGEAAGLKWRRIDFVRGLIEIHETFTKGRWATPKTNVQSHRAGPTESSGCDACAPAARPPHRP
jgi:integrase